MNAEMVASRTLKSLHYDFSVFTLDDFIAWIEKERHRKIFTIPWSLPPGLFGAWLTDAELPTEYIFFRNEVPKIHQVHIQLHELAHFLLGHQTLAISSGLLGKSVTGTAILPFNELARMRSDPDKPGEEEAELLASLIQEQVIRHSELNRLMEGGSDNTNIAGYLRDLGML
jgi:hypothetical protein